MASAALEAEASLEPVETNDNAGGDNEARDFEGEARKRGWRPLEDFKGDPAKFVDAEAFLESDALIGRELANTKKELAEVKKTLRQASTHFEKAEERAYQRAMADLEARHERAIEDGNVAEGKAVAKEMRELTADVKATASDFSEADVKDALAEWRADNPWYAKDEDRRLWADNWADKNTALAQSTPPAEFFAMITEAVEKRFGSTAAPRQKPASGVEAPTNRGMTRGGKTFADLPAMAQQMADKFHRQGVFGDPAKVTQAEARKKYAATYQWS